MNRRFVAGLVAVALLTACTNSKAASPPTTRPPLRPVGTSTTVADPLGPSPGSIDSQAIPLEPFGSGCSDRSIPFQVIAAGDGWSTIGALWRGIDPLSGNTGIVEVHRGASLPEPQNPAAMTVLDRPATIGAISDGFVVRFTTGSTGSLCDEWALVAHPRTTIGTLRGLAERITRFGAGEQTMDCAAGDAQVFPLNPGDLTIMNLIDLPTDRALQTGRELTNAGQSVLFAKNALVVHPVVAFDLVVPDQFRGLVGIGWGDDAQPVSIVHVPACQLVADPPVSLIYPGGFFALHPICATVRIIEFDEISDVRIGIGTPCNGQPPIEGPTET